RNQNDVMREMAAWVASVQRCQGLILSVIANADGDLKQSIGEALRLNIDEFRPDPKDKELVRVLTYYLSIIEHTPGESKPDMPVAVRGLH
ncbi:MAG: hypothetical protein ACU836_18790, partial [Gammaproteobacteria bacterium]